MMNVLTKVKAMQVRLRNGIANLETLIRLKLTNTTYLSRGFLYMVLNSRIVN
jgi:hypothetical protein